MDRRRRQLISVLACMGSVLFASSAAAQQQTIREALAAAQHSIWRHTSACGSPGMATVLRDTDVIVMGMIGDSNSHETSDHRDVVTDYEILQPIYLGRRPTARIPNLSAPFVVTLPGGTITVDGLTYTSNYDEVAAPAPGTWYLLLLKERPEGYALAATFLGAFKIDNGLMTPLTTKASFAPELRGAVAEDVARQWAEQLSRQPRRSPKVLEHQAVHR
jgi:hypothetical protein